ncbi:Uncharacterised protein [Vibrio cholerae]|nr:Uncharacterised protein [Vibrio cholerae]CSB80987.1 Uncharacterised protein [Vibrio cholerae]CSC66907.1 Uncharacterised protein [Vibrio cholerae]CSI59785.1 Uncharacterised protein [Vibrio cholerae]
MSLRSHWVQAGSTMSEKRQVAVQLKSIVTTVSSFWNARFILLRS